MNVDCGIGYAAGEKCDECASEYYKINSLCQSCGCDPEGRQNNNCDSNGTCTCQTGYAGDKCDLKCQCNVFGSTSTCVQSDDKCNCKTGYEGNKCEECASSEGSIDGDLPNNGSQCSGKDHKTIYN